MASIAHSIAQAAMAKLHECSRVLIFENKGGTYEIIHSSFKVRLQGPCLAARRPLFCGMTGAHPLPLLTGLAFGAATASSQL